MNLIIFLKLNLKFIKLQINSKHLFYVDNEGNKNGFIDKDEF